MTHAAPADPVPVTPPAGAAGRILGPTSTPRGLVAVFVAALVAGSLLAAALPRDASGTAAATERPSAPSGASPDASPALAASPTSSPFSNLAPSPSPVASPGRAWLAGEFSDPVTTWPAGVLALLDTLPASVRLAEVGTDYGFGGRDPLKVTVEGRELWGWFDLLALRLTGHQQVVAWADGSRTFWAPGIIAMGRPVIVPAVDRAVPIVRVTIHIAPELLRPDGSVDAPAWYPEHRVTADSCETMGQTFTSADLDAVVALFTRDGLTHVEREGPCYGPTESSAFVLVTGELDAGQVDLLVDLAGLLARSGVAMSLSDLRLVAATPRGCNAGDLSLWIQPDAWNPGHWVAEFVASLPQFDDQGRLWPDVALAPCDAG